MKNTSEMPLGSAFACRHCQFYSPQGRRGGHCQLLNVGVQGCWGACSLGALSFTPVVKPLAEPVHWSEQIPSRWVESAPHEVASSMVSSPSAVVRDPLPPGISRLRSPMADPSAA